MSTSGSTPLRCLESLIRLFSAQKSKHVFGNLYLWWVHIIWEVLDLSPPLQIPVEVCQIHSSAMTGAITVYEREDFCYLATQVQAAILRQIFDVGQPSDE